MGPKWYEIAKSQMGLHEDKDNGPLSKWLRSDGYALGDPSELPWCGDFVETSIRLALPNEKIPEKQYLARSWLNFGVELKEPVIGAVVVFWRKDRNGPYGHVGFYAGEDGDYIHVLGGNQSDTVSITKLSKHRLLGYRWPSSCPIIDGAGDVVTDDTVSENEE